MTTNERKEIRKFNFEVRAKKDEQHGNYLEGTPIVYDEWADLGWYDEQIRSGALADTDLRDVRFLVNHNTDMIPLARSRNNNENSTMQMTVTERGMEIRVDLDIEGNPRAAELYSAVKRGDITGMSFAFIVNEERWTDLDTDKPLRRIMSFSRIFEVSLVTNPAYEGTSVQAASEGDTLESVKASLESAREQLRQERAKEQDKERRQKAIEILRK